MSLIGYARVSTAEDKQLLDGVSTENGKNSTLRNFVEYLQN